MRLADPTIEGLEDGRLEGRLQPPVAGRPREEDAMKDKFIA